MGGKWGPDARVFGLQRCGGGVSQDKARESWSWRSVLEQPDGGHGDHDMDGERDQDEVDGHRHGWPGRFDDGNMAGGGIQRPHNC